MKLIILFSIIFSNNIQSAQLLSIDDVATKISKQNLVVLQNAEKMYQAKNSIDEARLSMLPKLNLWSLGKVAVDPVSLLDVAQEIAPFLAPANWFRLKESELLFQAEQEGYVALQANEIYVARAVFLKALMDQELYLSLTNYEKELASIRSVAEDRRDLGFESPELVREIVIQHLKIKEDIIQMNLLVSFEKSTLAEALAIPVDEEIFLTPLKLSNDGLNSPIVPKEWELIVLDSSPELKQFDQFIKVIPLIKKEIRFSILGVSNFSRGAAGGIFDDMPVSQGLGFSNGKQMAIVNSKETILKLQKKGVEETLKRQLLNVSQNHNSSFKIHALQKDRLVLSELNLRTFKEKLALGEEISLPEFTQTMLSLLQSQTSYFEAMYGVVMNYDRLLRLSFTGPYASLKNQKIILKTEETQCRKTIFGRLKCK
jgi:hypothetical protein